MPALSVEFRGVGSGNRYAPGTWNSPANDMAGDYKTRRVRFGLLSNLW